MKIAVCGKGGCGKSTITSLLAKELARKCKRVLVIDSDESNYGLHKQLGMEFPGDFTEYFGGKNKSFKTMMTGEVLSQIKLSAFAKKFFTETWTLDDIPPEYLSVKDGVMLMASGKIHEANEGCACAMGSILKEMLVNLKLKSDEFVIADMEAGIEHFGRGVDNSVDMIMMIVDPSFESLRLSTKIKELGNSIQKPVYFCLNRTTEESIAPMLDMVSDRDKVICQMPLTVSILRAGLNGEELQDSYKEIQRLAEFFITKNTEIEK